METGFVLETVEEAEATEFTAPGRVVSERESTVDVSTASCVVPNPEFVVSADTSTSISVVEDMAILAFE